MTIKTTGPLSFTEIVTEFGDTTPPTHGLSEFYAGGANVPAGTVGFPGGVSTPIPASGKIAYSNFYGAAKITGLKGSLRFRGISSFTKNFAADDGSTKKTFAGWVKRGLLGTREQTLFSAVGGTFYDEIRFLSDDKLEYFHTPSGSGRVIRYQSSAVFRDPSAWYHITVSIDSTLASANDRVKMYINGTQLTWGNVIGSGLDANAVTAFGQNRDHIIGGWRSNSEMFDGYMTDLYFITGQALDASSFGETDSHGMWIPKKYSGAYGANGFHLAFDKSAAPTDLGKDSSGNNNDWNVNGFSIAADSTMDVMRDVPNPVDEMHGNYATLNPLAKGTGVSTKDGNLTAVISGPPAESIQSTFGMSSGKWYCEMTAGSGGSMIGISKSGANLQSWPGNDVNGYGWRGDTGQIMHNNSATGTGGIFAVNDVIGVAFDADSGKLWYSKNGAWISSGDPSTGTSPSISSIPIDTWFITVGRVNATNDAYLNFGQQLFKHTPPTGFKPLNTFNLP